MNAEAKRLLAAFLLTFGFLFVWTKYFTPKQPLQTTADTTTTTQTVGTPTTQSPTTTSNSSAKLAPTSISNAKQIPIETFETSTPEYKATFSNQSGAVNLVQLSKYQVALKKDSPLVSVVPLAQPTDVPLLWNISFRGSQSAQATAEFSDQNTIYTWGEKSANAVSFVNKINPDITITKSYKLDEKPYVINQVVRIENSSANTYYVDAKTSLTATHNAPGPNEGFLMFKPNHPDVTGVAFAHDDAMFWTFKDFGKGKAIANVPPIGWAGFSSQYFLLTAIPAEGVWNDLKGDVQNDVAHLNMEYPERNLSPNSNLEYAVKLYAGPKQMELLAVTEPSLDKSINLGSWVGGLARLIHKLLNAIYKFIPNYGWAIILLTVIVRLAVFPLAQMQARSMKRMTQHKPAMDALKTKYENDRETYSRELMAYMRTHRINPASGCLPLLIQFPIFIALYRVLYNSIELRHATFGLWIHDLSAHDPFFVLPVLVGITFFLQTKLNPTPMADPAQQTMMKIMPIMFSVFMIFLPSGLNLYIFTSTLWGIVQQYMVQKQITTTT